MKWKFVICHYSEIGLKGKNRKFFEEKLVNNIKKKLSESSYKKVRRISGRILVELEEGTEEEVKNNLKKVFGIASFSFAVNCEQKIEEIKKTGSNILKEEKFKTFRISTKRSEKSFYLNSQEINEKVGEWILEKIDKAKVNLEKPDITLFIEIVENYSFLYLEKVKGLGGLPVGSSGKVVSLLSGGIDSPVASFLIQGRGSRVIFLHFHAYPFASKESIEKVEKLAEILNEYQLESKLYLVPFSEIQKEILLKTKEKFRVILYRRFMFRIAEQIARKEKAKGLVTGESLGQVASQTLENIGAIEEVVSLPVLRPLIAKDKEEIIKKAEEIGSYKISILPHQDCCSRFLPKHPETKSRIEEVTKEEKKLDVQKLIKETIKNITLKKYGE